MKSKTDLNLPTAIALALLLVLLTASVHGVADTGAKEDPERVLLQKMYQLRMAYEQERARRDNEARANVRLVTQTDPGRVDTPTVTGLRAQTNAQLTRFEQQFRCLDVEVDNGGGNTVVICGDNSGDISGNNVSAGNDIVTLPGGTP